MSVANTLAERGSRYGAFADHARIAQGLQDVLRAAPKWDQLDQDMKQALSVMCDKFARILNGDPYYADNWHDIQGYAKLIEDRVNMIVEAPQTLYEEPKAGSPPTDVRGAYMYKDSPLSEGGSTLPKKPWMLNGETPISHGFPSK